MYTMSKGWEKFFHLATYLTQGPSFLSPRGYAILHRMHHAFQRHAEGPALAHEPFTGVVDMMLATKKTYDDYAYNRIQPEARFDGGLPSWPALDKARAVVAGAHRVGCGVHPLLLQVRDAPLAVGVPSDALLHGPDPRRDRELVRAQVRLPELRQRHDQSRNTLIFDFVTGGEGSFRTTITSTA